MDKEIVMKTYKHEKLLLDKRELSFQSETILDTKMSKIYKLLDEHNIPIDEQLKIHQEIIEMLNVMEKCNSSKI